MKIIDISLPLHPDIPTWPGCSGFILNRYKRLELGDDCNSSRYDCDIHTGTHVDAPFHFLQNGATVEQLPLEIFIGPARLAHLPDVHSITAHDLESLNLTSDINRLLLRTHNSEFWVSGSKEFREDYVSIAPDGARWLANQGIRLIGIDYLSIGGFKNNGAITHKILLDEKIIIVEGLNLHGVEPGNYELICLPMKIEGAEGAPARAVLIKKDQLSL